MSNSASWPVVDAPAWDNIPPELAERPQWIVWKYEENTRSKDPNPKPLKMPYYVAGGRRSGDAGNERELKRLVTLERARKHFERGGWTGVGFCFLKDDGFVGVDIDNAINPETGEMSPLCLTTIEYCSSYTEKSPSGTGVHILMRGSTHINKFDPIGLEVYSGRLYFAFTGRRWAGTPAQLGDATPEILERLHSTINQAKEAAQAAKHVHAAPSPRARPPAQPNQGGDDFRRVNDAAMANLHVWVPTIFPGAKARGDQYRITSKELGRDLQEDLSIDARGIKDWGVADMGDARDGARTAIDLVMEWTAHKKPKEALHWLAQLVGVEISAPRKPDKPRATVPAAAGQRGAQGGGGGGRGGGGGDDGGHDDYDSDEADRAAAELDGLLVMHRGRPMDCRENVMYCLTRHPELKGLVRKNDFNGLFERSRIPPWEEPRPPGEWDEEDDLMLGEYLLRVFRMSIKSKGTLRDGVTMAARMCRYNPVQDRIKAQRWDKLERLDMWLTSVFGVESTEYTRLIGRCFFMGLVKRAMQPGCKFDYMLILKGEQGLRKSSVFKEIAYPYFTDNALRIGDKDSQMAQQLAWVVEAAELESLNKSESTQIKQHLSADEDWYRPPYGSQMIRAPRHSVHVGTTNADTFLKDATGDRRFWPLEVHHVYLDILRLQLPQLLAEALVLVEAGERYWPTKEEEKRLIFPEQEQFKRVDPWEDKLNEYVNARSGHLVMDQPPADRDFFPTTELYAKALDMKMDRVDGNGQADTRLSNAMKALGFVRYRETSGSRRRGWQRSEGDPTPPAPAEESREGGEYVPPI